jgi:hypothetical protein
MNTVQKHLVKWKKSTNELIKVQYAYALLGIVLFMLGAIVSLINAPVGAVVLFLAFVSLLALIANGLIWSLLNTFVIPRIQATKSTRK